MSHEVSRRAASIHWTQTLSAEHATTKLGARFHLRKLFLRQEEFSTDELEYIIQYLTNETTLPDQVWWSTLTHYERFEIASCLKMHSVRKNEEYIFWFSSMEAAKDCILIYGTAYAKPIDPSIAPVLHFAEGSVVGNLSLPPRLRSNHNKNGDAKSPINGSATTWRRVKREQAFRNALQHYNRIVINGPADFLFLNARDVFETISKVADRMERDNWVKAFGFERFAGCIRRKIFEPGMLLAKEDEHLNAIYIIVEGECRASVRADDTASSTPTTQFPTSHRFKKSTTAEEMLLHIHQFRSSERTQLPIATLGPKSFIGDISVALGIPEPTTIEALTTVTALTLSQEDLLKECEDAHDPDIAGIITKLRKVAFDTLSFVLERVEDEATHEQCDQRLKIQSIRDHLRTSQEVIALDATLDTTLKKSSFMASRKAATTSNSHNQTNHESSTYNTASEMSKSSSLPLVVQKHIKAKEDLVKDNLLSRYPDHHRRSEDVTAPIQFAAEETLCPSRMTRQQKKMARTFSSLAYSAAARSLGDMCNDVRQELKLNDQQLSECDSRYQHDALLNADDQKLFLVPTMTRQRQLHGK